MTDIHPINEVAQSNGASTSKALKVSKSDGFENALSKALDKKEAPEMESTQTNALGEIAFKDLKILNSTDIVFGKTDQLLKMLDVYSSKLENPGVSLKSIAPVLEEIRDTAGSLLKETQRLTDSDAKLKEIATQTIVTAQTEYLKFQRGDYLS